MTSVNPGYNQMGGPLNIKQAEAQVRMGFIRKVYTILSWQLLLTVAVAYPLQGLPRTWYLSNQWLLMASLGGTLAAICAMACFPQMTRTVPQNYIFLFAFTLCEAVLVGFVSAQYTAGAVAAAAAATTLIFLGMTLYAWTSKSDFTGMGPYLIGALLALFALGCLQGLLTCVGIEIPMMTKLYCACGVVLFTMYIVYDTQLIIGCYKGHKEEFSVDDYVPAALNLYLDIINLFLELLQLLNSRD